MGKVDFWGCSCLPARSYWLKCPIRAGQPTEQKGDKSITVIETAFEPRAQNRSNCTAHSEVFQFRIAVMQLMGSMPLVKTTFIKGRSRAALWWLSLFFPLTLLAILPLTLQKWRTWHFGLYLGKKSRPTKCKKEHQIWPFKCVRISFSGGEVVNRW